MLKIIKTNLKKHIQHKGKSSAYALTTISNNFLPYSCLVDDDVLLTKNGEIFQIIEIKMTDFTKNKDMGLRNAVRKAICNNNIDTRCSFWVQTIKKKKEKLTKNTNNNNIKNFFLQKVSNTIEEIKQSLNQYDIITYITIIHGNKNHNASPLEILKSSINFIDITSSVQKRIASLKADVSCIMQQLADYNPHILGVRIDENENKYSELMEFLYFIVNHKQKEMIIEDVDITDKINESSYLFQNGKMLFQNSQTDKINIAGIFTIKEVQDFSMSITSDIINNINAEMIITDYIDGVDQKTTNGIIRAQNNLIKNDNEESSTTKPCKYYQSSTSIIVFDEIENQNDKINEFVKCASVFAEKGIVVVQEDIGVERSYYAMMPANFSFVYRLSFHKQNEICSFIYSYIFQEQNIDIFVKNFPLLNIGTLKNNPVQIGFLKDNSNILISGPDKCGKGILANLLTSAWLNAFNSNIIYVALNKESSSFIDAIGGKNYRISTDQIKNNTKFNLLNFKDFEDKQDIQTYLSNMLSLMMSIDGLSIDGNYTNKVNSVLNVIMEHCNTDNKNQKPSLSSLHSYFKGIEADEYLKQWYLIGKYYHLFDNKDDVFDDINIAHFYIDETISNNASLLSIIVNHLFTRIVNCARASNKPTIVVVDEPFILFSDTLFAKLLNDIEDITHTTDTHFIFKIQDFEKEIISSVDFSKIISSCGLQLHFANKDIINSNYMRIFQLTKPDYTTINALSKFDGINFFVKYLDDSYCCQLNIQDKKLLSILSDPDSYAYNNILNIKNNTMSYDPNSYIARYFSTTNI